MPAGAEPLQLRQRRAGGRSPPRPEQGLARPDDGASRRIEAQIGVLLGPAEMGVNQHTMPGGLAHAATLIKRAHDREDFRILANALNGNVPLAPAASSRAIRS
jgi:hypothetical protein